MAANPLPRFREWTPDMSVGVKSLDDDHKRLFSFVTEFVESVEQDDGALIFDAVFRDLIDYTRYHFEREEAAMEVCGYTFMEEHRAQHHALTEKMLEHRDRFMLSAAHDQTTAIEEFLLSWLGIHILGSDLHYRDCMQAHADAVEKRLKELENDPLKFGGGY